MRWLACTAAASQRLGCLAKAGSYNRYDCSACCACSVLHIARPAHLRSASQHSVLPVLASCVVIVLVLAALRSTEIAHGSYCPCQRSLSVQCACCYYAACVSPCCVQNMVLRLSWELGTRAQERSWPRRSCEHTRGDFCVLGSSARQTPTADASTAAGLHANRLPLGSTRHCSPKATAACIMNGKHHSGQQQMQQHTASPLLAALAISTSIKHAGC